MFYYLLFIKINYDLYLDLMDTLNLYYGKVVDSDFTVDSCYIILKEENLANDLDEYLSNMITDNLLKSKVFKSKLFNNTESILNEIPIKLKILNNVGNYHKEIFFNEEELLSFYFKKKIDIDIKKHILKKFYQDEEMLKTLKVFFENDLNILETSKKLNVHRNTLNYRLNKFYEVTKLDVKCLENAFIVKQLL